MDFNVDRMIKKKGYKVKINDNGSLAKVEIFKGKKRLSFGWASTFSKSEKIRNIQSVKKKLVTSIIYEKQKLPSSSLV